MSTDHQTLQHPRSDFADWVKKLTSGAPHYKSYSRELTLLSSACPQDHENDQSWPLPPCNTKIPAQWRAYLPCDTRKSMSLHCPCMAEIPSKSCLHTFYLTSTSFLSQIKDPKQLFPGSEPGNPSSCAVSLVLKHKPSIKPCLGNLLGFLSISIAWEPKNLWSVTITGLTLTLCSTNTNRNEEGWEGVGSLEVILKEHGANAGR